VLFGLVQIQQFGLAEVEDDGDALRVVFSGRDEDGELLDGMRLRLRCDASGCGTSTGEGDEDGIEP